MDTLKLKTTHHFRVTRPQNTLCRVHSKLLAAPITCHEPGDIGLAMTVLACKLPHGDRLQGTALGTVTGWEGPEMTAMALEGILQERVDAPIGE